MKFGIESKIANIITDNATNMMSVFSLPGFYIIITTEDRNAVSESNDLDNNFDTDSELHEALTTEYNSCVAHTLKKQDS